MHSCLCENNARRQPSKQLPQPEALKQPTLLQKTSSQIPAKNAQNSLKPNAAAFEPIQPRKFSFHSSLGTEQASQTVTNSSQALIISKAIDIFSTQGFIRYSTSDNGPDRPGMIASSEPKPQQSQGNSTTVSTEQLNPQHPSGSAEETWLTNDGVHSAEEAVCIKEHLELSQQQLFGPEFKTTRRFQASARSCAQIPIHRKTASIQRRCMWMLQPLPKELRMHRSTAMLTLKPW